MRSKKEADLAFDGSIAYRETSQHIEAGIHYPLLDYSIERVFFDGYLILDQTSLTVYKYTSMVAPRP